MSNKDDIKELLGKVLIIMKEGGFSLDDLNSLSAIFGEAKKATENLIIKAQEKLRKASL